ncbi:MAG: hypothetical protein AAGB22_13610, partial [Bacteroidota bacterium]
SGSPQNTGSYSFSIKRAADGATVHGPYFVSAFVENVPDWASAVGPAVLNDGVGYATDDERYVFAPGEAGLYYIEFQNVNFIGYWDFTVAGANGAIPGRVYSRNWAFRTPTVQNVDPECVWDREFNGHLFSYTTDGFVTALDFAGSGLQGLSFTMAFNRRGPGMSGDLAEDRKSVPNANVTETAAEHLVFLHEPDPVLFPDGDCGVVDAEANFNCVGTGGYCLELSVTRPGQVEVIIDADQDGVFTPNLDRRLLYDFEEGQSLSTCLPWDGLLGDGQPVDAGALLNLQINYTQGVQHWGVFDAEFLKYGFCVEPVRPICSNEQGTNVLYWDDRNLTELPGTGQPLDGRAGCDRTDLQCRTWDNFLPNIPSCDEINDDLTTGYGDKSTMNTWWFANVVTETLVEVPLTNIEITGTTT